MKLTQILLSVVAGLALLLLVTNTGFAAPPGLIVNTIDFNLTPDGQCSIREAIEVIQFDVNNDCGRLKGKNIPPITFDLTLPATIEFLHSISIIVPVVIEGPGTYDDLTFTTDGDNRHFVVEGPGASNDGQLTLSNITLTGGNSGGGGPGSIHVLKGGLLTVSHVKFIGNESGSGASPNGGAIGVQGQEGLSEPTSATVEHSVFEDNLGQGGGAIAVYYVNSNLEVSMSTFLLNESSINGGAIQVYYEGPTATISQSHFIGNYADGSGGAIWVRDGTVDISDSVFAGNVSTDDGGAISSYVAAVSGETTSTTVSNSTIVGNMADGNGGGISNVAAVGGNDSTTTIDGGVVIRNLADADANTLGDGNDVLNRDLGDETGNAYLCQINAPDIGDLLDEGDVCP